MDDTPCVPCADDAQTHVQEAPRRTVGGCAVNAKPCGAALRGPRKGKTCINPAMANGRCRMHGGAQPSGLASPNIINGRRSKYFTGRALADYESSLANEQAKTLTDEIAQIDAYITELVGRLESGERGTVYDDLQHVLQSVKDGMAPTAALTEIEAIAAKGKSTVQARRELGEAYQLKAKLVATEAKRQVDMQEVATKPQMVLFVGAMGKLVLQTMSIPAERRAMGEGLAAIAHHFNLT